MPIQRKYFDDKALLEKINADALTGHQLAMILESEINRVEQLKIILVEDIEKNPEATVRLTNDIDSYIFHIQEILAGMAADRYSRQVLATERMQQIRNEILNLLSESS